MSKQASVFVICVLPGWLFGDPHIRSADGFRYTFNGLGEYTLLQADEATLQGRTAQARREDGRQTNATVFSAFAAKDTRSGRVHVALNESRDGNVSYCVFRTNSVDVFFFYMVPNNDRVSITHPLYTTDSTCLRAINVFNHRRA